MKKLFLIIFLFISTLSHTIKAESVRELYVDAKTFAKEGKYPLAISKYKEILEILKDEPEFRRQYLKPYSDLLLTLGSHAEVIELLNNESDLNDIVLQMNLASAYGYAGEYEKATNILIKLLQEEEITPGQKAIILQNLGFIFMEMKEWQKAYNYLEDSIEHLDEINVSIARSNMALSLAHLGEFEKALNFIDSSLASLKIAGPGHSRDYIKALRKKGEIFLLMGDRESAEKTLKSFFNLEKEWLINSLPDYSLDRKLSLWLSEKPLLSKCFLLEDYSPEFLFDVASFRRLTSMLGLQDNERLTDLLNSGSKEIKKNLDEGEVAIEFISYEDKNGDEQYAVITLPAVGESKFVKLFTVDYIYKKDNQGNSLYSRVLSNEEEDKQSLYEDTILANLIWQPIIASIPQNTQKIYFAPEGIFHFLGIEHLPFDGNDKYEIKRVSTTSLLTNLQESHKKPEKILIIGGLDYYSFPVNDEETVNADHAASDLLVEKYGTPEIFYYLGGTQIETDSIGALLEKSDVLNDAGERRVKYLLPKYPHLHIATHGYALSPGVRKFPEFLTDSLAVDKSLQATGLALTGANVLYNFSNKEDGILSAREICSLDLTDVDMVVLSACQTAQGDLFDEGPAGLVRGLKNAGAKTILATLWTVNDRSTALFMQEFYRLLVEGKSKYRAFKGATNKLKKYKNPYYWAPFILIDDI